MTNIENFNPENLLKARIESMSRSEAMDLGMKLCEELTPFSEDDKFHGSVRPDNISIEGEEVTLGPSLPQHEELGADELEYISPEQFWNGLRGPACDVYSLGLVLYAACNDGRLPFMPEIGDYSPEDRANALRRRMQGEEPAPPAAAGEKFGAIILKAISFSAEKRYKNAQEMLRALRSCPMSEQPIKSGDDVEEAAPVVIPASDKEYKVDKEFEATTPQKPKKPGLTTGAVIMLVLAAVAVVAILIIFFGRDTTPEEVEQSPGTTVSASPVATVSGEVIYTAAPTPAVTATAQVTPDLEEYDSPIDLVRYEAVLSDLSWEEAAAKCEEMGGHLATVKNQAELDEIIALCEEIGASYVWLGAYRAEGDKWTWVTGDAVDFFVWDEGEPSYADSDGVQNDFLLLWNVRFGESGWRYNDSRENPVDDYPRIYSGKTAFICEYDINN